MAKKNETLFHPELNPAPKSVFKQELITWHESDGHVVRKTLTRHFNGDRFHDAFISEPLLRDRGSHQNQTDQQDKISEADLDRMSSLIRRDLKGEIGYPTGLGLIALRKRHPKDYQDLLRQLKSEAND